MNGGYGITLEGLLLKRVSDLQEALLVSNYPLAENALNLIWQLIPNEEALKKIDEVAQKLDEEFQEKMERLQQRFKEKEYDSATRDLRLRQEQTEYYVNRINTLAEVTIRVLVEYNLLPRKPAAP